MITKANRPADRAGEFHIVKNTRSRAGAEVAQVYVRDIQCSSARPLKDLKGFQKVLLRPGESRSVDLELDSNAFCFWHPQTKKWMIEPGEFEILIGASSRGIKLQDKVALNP